NQETFDTIQLLLRDVGDPADANVLSQQSKSQIEYALRTRLDDAMSKKKLREDRLLWPKTK
ncbi:MAG: hypothetical protein IBJ01_13675, partial [Leptospira sp.]|nr:hypothetical protein [Leptospira sp.]